MYVLIHTSVLNGLSTYRFFVSLSINTKHYLCLMRLSIHYFLWFLYTLIISWLKEFYIRSYVCLINALTYFIFFSIRTIYGLPKNRQSKVLFYIFFIYKMFLIFPEDKHEKWRDQQVSQELVTRCQGSGTQCGQLVKVQLPEPTMCSFKNTIHQLPIVKSTFLKMKRISVSFV